MSIVTPVAEGQRCGCCNEPLTATYASFDEDLRVTVCAECRMRLMLGRHYLENSGIKKCRQVSGGQPLTDPS